jgi:hypothetical protein
MAFTDISVSRAIIGEDSGYGEVPVHHDPPGIPQSPDPPHNFRLATRCGNGGAFVVEEV